jgi:aminomethyltransferase
MLPQAIPPSLEQEASHWQQPLRHTPFHARARALCRTDRFVAWSGYSTVDVFTSVEHEYFAIRNTASVYDISPMIKYRIAGPDAERYLNRLVARNVAKLRPGRVAYAVWCDDDGGMIDDGTIFRFGTDEFRLCAAERQLDWLLDSAIGFDVEVEDFTESLAALSLQGPTSAAILRALGMPGIDVLRPFEIADWVLDGHRCSVSRTGFTGDLGYELWLAPASAEAVWDRLMQTGTVYGVHPIGSQALNLARIEAGLLLPNVDFHSAQHAIRAGRTRSPLELGLEFAVDFEKGHFNGRRALLAERARGLRRRLVGLDVEGNKPAHGALIYADRRGRRRVGAVTSAAWSPTCKRNLAFAMIDGPHFAVGGTLWAEIYVNRELEWEQRMAPCRVVERTFFVHDRRRATPPGDR